MGGVGIDAIGRGARFVCFVDKSRKACSIIRENLKSLAVTHRLSSVGVRSQQSFGPLRAGFPLL